MNGSVLIVDDSLTVRMDLAGAFEEAGFQPCPCGTLAEARQYLAAGGVDAMVLDVLLPDGDGIEFLGEVRGWETGRTLPVLMLSAEAEVRDRIRGLRTGADEYVGKPYDLGYVVAKAGELVRIGRKSSGNGLLRILIIDDSSTFREALKEALDKAGYEVLLAGTAEEGLRIAAAQRPSAMVVDGVLPGMDGRALIRRVRLDGALRGIPCVLLTGSLGCGAEVGALDAGADAFATKDQSMDIILARIAAVVRHSSAPHPRAGTASLSGPKRILAVDDSPTFLQALAAAMEGEGYDVVLAHSGEEALDLLAVQPVDCILLDLLMPGMGGQEACRLIKAAPIVREIPLLMLTAREDREAMIEGLGAGADDYIPKSSEFEVLRARVRAQIRRKQFEDENRRIREELLGMELETQKAQAAQELAEARAVLVVELEKKNAELEAYSYSVSHDLRAPLRSINGFSQILLEDYQAGLDPEIQGYLVRIRGAGVRMEELIDDLLNLSRLGKVALARIDGDLSRVARSVVEDLAQGDCGRNVKVVIAEGLVESFDPRMMRIVLENLIGNAWKFTGRTPDPQIEFSAQEGEKGKVYCVRDNGAGFDPAYGAKLFRPFQRLHGQTEFPGTGIGLTTVHRIIEKHGGRIWAHGTPGSGAAFFFTLG